MGGYLFSFGPGHLTELAGEIAAEHGATLVNHIDPKCQCGHGCLPHECERSKTHWFAAPNRGEPFDSDLRRRLNAALMDAGPENILIWDEEEEEDEDDE